MHKSLFFLPFLLCATACSSEPEVAHNGKESQAGALKNSRSETGDRVETFSQPGANQIPSSDQSATSAPAAAASFHDDWIGRWIGVEGLNLMITKTPTAGHYSLKMQYGTDTDTAGTFDGVATSEGISFTRPDGSHILRAATGDETGLKYLSGKTDCLKVKDGEGYCRG